MTNDKKNGFEMLEEGEIVRVWNGKSCSKRENKI